MKLEEKQEILGNIEELMDEEQQSLFSFQNIFAMLVLNWQWFFLSLFIFLCGALLYLRYTEPVYQLSSRMLIKDDQRGRRSSQMLANMQDLGFMTNSAGIDNEIEVLQSRVLLRDVVRELKLYTEYRTNGRIRDFIVYGNQPVNVDLDPASLDSLDKALLEGGMVGSLNMQITRTDEGYKLEGRVFNGGSAQVISRVVKALPASFKTAIGTMTLTEAAGRTMEVGEVSKVTLVPPMQVATRYLGSLTVSPTSKMTDIAEITLKDKNVRRGMDFLRHLAECYNRQANADKNEIALRTEEFINDRIEKINAELGTTEGELESFKRRNAVTNISVDASQSVQMSSQFSTRLSEANSQIQMLDYLRASVLLMLLLRV